MWRLGNKIEKQLSSWKRFLQSGKQERKPGNGDGPVLFFSSSSSTSSFGTVFLLYKPSNRMANVKREVVKKRKRSTRSMRQLNHKGIGHKPSRLRATFQTGELKLSSLSYYRPIPLVNTCTQLVMPYWVLRFSSMLVFKNRVWEHWANYQWPLSRLKKTIALNRFTVLLNNLG